MKALLYTILGVVLFAAVFASTSSRVLVGGDQFAFVLLIPIVAGIVLVFRIFKWFRKSVESVSDQKDGNLEESVRKKAQVLENFAADSKTVLEQQLTKAWKLSEEELARLSIEVQKRSKKARRFWMKKRISQVLESHSDTFDFLSQNMSDDNLLEIRIEYQDCCKSINRLESELADIRASIAMNSEEPGGPRKTVDQD